MQRMFKSVLLLVTLPVGLLGAQSSGSAVAPMVAGGPAAMRALGAFLTEKFGSSVIYEADLRCASRRLCQSESSTPVGKSDANARRQVLRQEFLGVQHGARVGVRSSSVTCNVVDCRVRGASRFVQMKEPIMRGDTAVVALHVYENGAKGVLIRSYLVKMMNSGPGWSVLSMDRQGFTRGG